MTALSPQRRSALALLVAMALVAAACSGGGQEGPETTGDSAAAPATSEAPPCRHDGLPAQGEALLTGGDPVEVSAAVAAATHRCSHTAVVAPADDAWAAALAAAVAVDRDAPLLLTDRAQPDRVRPALDRLAPTEVVSIGVDGAVLGPEVTTLGAPQPATTPPPGDSPHDPGDGSQDPGSPAPDPGSTGATADAAPPPAWDVAVEVGRFLQSRRYLAVGVDDVEARAAIAGHLRPGSAVLALPADPTQLDAVARSLPDGAEVTVLASDPAGAEPAIAALAAVGVGAGAAAGPLWPDTPAGAAWLVDPAQGPVAAVAAAAAAGRAEPLLPVTATDLRSGRDRAGRVRQVGPSRVALVGAVTPDASWQLPVITGGPQLPGGGYRLFEGERMVALYGHPSHPVLGALGEQDLDATVERARAVAAPYGADGARVTPAFEVIATVASAEAGDLGDYSRRTPIEVLRPYVERAAAEGFYVVLDLQPGRTDFLTQAKEYEELLREPHVGLALDPEWRLLPDQVHLHQVGSVAAPEVQRVVDWLAQLTRRHQLPEKLLVLHQFRTAMIPDRDTLVDRPELAVVVHMDGQGPIGSKDGTYRAITAGAEDRWLWGWKNFFDEDQPTPSPDHVLSRRPAPVFVTYQ